MLLRVLANPKSGAEFALEVWMVVRMLDWVLLFWVLLFWTVLMRLKKLLCLLILASTLNFLLKSRVRWSTP